MSRFHVHDTFATEDKATFVFAGFVLEGPPVDAGMAVHVPFNASVNLHATIDHVECLNRPSGSVTCLCIRCRVPGEVALWEALNLKNHIIEIK